MSFSLIVDIDGVACDHAKAICDWVNAEYKLAATPSHVTSRDHDFGPITFGEAVNRCYPNEEFIMSMMVSEGFMDFYEALQGKADITFATARIASQAATEAWIKKHFPNKSVVFTPQKSLLLNHDFLIDDFHSECIKSAEKGIHSLLIKRPWNSDEIIARAIANHSNITYCTSFTAALSTMGVMI